MNCKVETRGKDSKLRDAHRAREAFIYLFCFVLGSPTASAAFAAFVSPVLRRVFLFDAECEINRHAL